MGLLGHELRTKNQFPDCLSSCSTDSSALTTTGQLEVLVVIEVIVELVELVFSVPVDELLKVL